MLLNNMLLQVLETDKSPKAKIANASVSAVSIENVLVELHVVDEFFSAQTTFSYDNAFFVDDMLPESIERKK